MQRLVTSISSMFFLPWPFEPSIENLKVQIIIEETHPCLHTARLILLAITRALTRYRYYEDITGMLAEKAAMSTVRISKFVEAAEGSFQNFDKIAQLEKILCNIHKFVQSETQSKFYFGKDIASKYAHFNESLTVLLDSFEQAVSRLPTASEDQVVSPSTGLSDPEDVLTIHRQSMFSGAQNFVVTGGAYYNILGNYVNVAESKDEESSRTFEGLLKAHVWYVSVTDEEVSADRQIQKGNGYRLYSAQLSGRIVAMKVYIGRSSKERCREAAKFYQKVIHPNIPHMIGVSPFKSERSFLIFHGEYEGTVDYMLAQALKDGLQQSLVLGLKTVAGLSSGLDYLHDLDYPLVSAGLDHFVLLSCGGKLTITFNPEDLGQINQSNRHLASADKALELFHGLCRKTFDAARKSHYESLDVYSDEGDSDTDDPLEIDSETHIPAANVPSDASISSPTFSSTSLASPAPPFGLPRRSPRNGRRQELVWKPQTAENLTLDDISRQFQDFLITQPSPPVVAFNRRRGRRSRQTARSAHRCRGYNRIEITLTSEVMRSVIVFNSTPTPHEICSVCKEVVKDAEIFNCFCGIDDESMPTVKCSVCSEWHHQLCVDFFASEDQRFICTSCKTAHLRAQRNDLDRALNREQQRSNDLEREGRRLLEVKQKLEADKRKIEEERERERRALKEVEVEQRKVEEKRERERRTLKELERERDDLEREKDELERVKYKLERELKKRESGRMQKVQDEKQRGQPSGTGNIAARRVSPASSNSTGGTDILLTEDNAMFRSSRYVTGGRIRYSYVKPDGETYDISDIIEEEWRVKDYENDVLEGVLGDANRDEIEEKLNRVLNRLTSSR